MKVKAPAESIKAIFPLTLPISERRHATMRKSKSDTLPCEFTYPDGKSCGDPSVCHSLCRRHYAQERRGRLGETKEIASPGAVEVKPTISVTISPLTLAKLDKRADKLGKSRSETVEEILSANLG